MEIKRLYLGVCESSPQTLSKLDHQWCPSISGSVFPATSSDPADMRGLICLAEVSAVLESVFKVLWEGISQLSFYRDLQD